MVAQTIEALLPGQVAMALLDGMRRLRYPQLRQRARENQRVFASVGSPERVLQGPFKGLRYVSRAYFGSVLPKILATYEMELWPAMETLCGRKPDWIVDLGAAEGYYAVGLAMRNPQARVVAFEIYKPAWTLLRDLAKRNGVADRIEMRGAATQLEISAVLTKTRNPLLISDIEGFEVEILDPRQIPELSRTMMLIEIHADYRPGVLEIMRERFGATHRIEHIKNRDRTMSDLPPGTRVAENDLAIATDEGRREAQWLFCLPNEKHSAD